MDDAIVAASRTSDSAFVLLSRQGERIAALEVAVGGVKEDTASMRAMNHETRRELQLLVISEQRCFGQLEALGRQYGDVQGQISRLATTVEALVELRNQGEGAWWMAGRLMASITAIFGATVVLVGAMFWALGHLTVQVK